MIADKAVLEAQLDTVKDYIINNLQVMHNPKTGGFFFGIDGFEHTIGTLNGTLKCSFYGLTDATKAAAIRATRVNRDLDNLSVEEQRAIRDRLEAKFGG